MYIHQSGTKRRDNYEDGVGVRERLRVAPPVDECEPLHADRVADLPDLRHFQQSIIAHLFSNHQGVETHRFLRRVRVDTPERDGGCMGAAGATLGAYHYVRDQLVHPRFKLFSA